MSYTPTTWAAGDTVTAAKLNKLEQGVASGGVLVVKFTAGRDGWTCDKTYAEIVLAITSGTPLMCLTANSETGNVKYSDYNQAVDALFFEVDESTLYVFTLTIDSSNSVSEATYSITLT